MAESCDVHKELENIAEQAQILLERSNKGATNERAADLELNTTEHDPPLSPGGTFVDVASTVEGCLQTLEAKHSEWKSMGAPMDSPNDSQPDVAIHPAAARAFDTLMQTLLKVLHLSASYDTQHIRSMKPGETNGSAPLPEAAATTTRVRAAQRVAVDLLRAVPIVSRLAFNKLIAGYEGMMRVQEVYTAILDALTGQPGGAPATQLPADMKHELSRRLSLEVPTSAPTDSTTQSLTAPMAISGRQGSATPMDVLALARSPRNTSPAMMGAASLGSTLADLHVPDVCSHPLADEDAGGRSVGGEEEEQEEGGADPHELAQAALLQAAALPLNEAGCAHIRAALQRQPCMVLLRMVLRLKDNVSGGAAGSDGGAAVTQA